MTSASAGSGRSASGARARPRRRAAASPLERRFGALTVRRIERPAAAVSYDFVARWADARVTRRWRGSAAASCPSRRPHAVPGHRRQLRAPADRRGRHAPARGVVAPAGRRRRRSCIEYPAVRLGRSAGRGDRSSQRLDAQGGARARSTCACGRRRRAPTAATVTTRNEDGWKLHRFDTSARAGQTGAGAVRDHVAGPRGARTSRWPRRRASEALALDARTDRPPDHRALLALATVVWLLAVEGRQGFGRDEGQYFRAGERYWGWFEELGDNIAHGRPGRSFTRAGDRSLLERQRARSPGRS